MKIVLLTCLFVSSLSFAQDSGFSCKQAYEKAKWKTQHKKTFHKMITLFRARKASEFGKGTSRADVQAAIDYGFKSGIYCQEGRILSQKEFQLQTVENMKAVKAAKDNNGVDLASTIESESKMNCRDLVKMKRTNKEDGYTRRAFLLAADLHNIEKAYSESHHITKVSTSSESNSEEDSKKSSQDKRMLRAQKIKDRFLNSVQKRAMKKYDDSSITMDDVHRVFDESIEDGTACNGRKVLNRSQMRKQMLAKLADKESRSNAVNSELPVNMKVIFQQNGEDQDVDIQGIEAQDA